jgi:hypothetical protein
MKNITVAISDHIHREARVWAARHDTSVSAVVAFLLQNLDAVVALRTKYDASVAPACEESAALTQD